jgi:hypothetical protein
MMSSLKDLPGGTALALAVAAICWTNAAAQPPVPLAQALLEDMLPPSSTRCGDSGGGSTSFSFDFAPSDSVSQWDAMSEAFEQVY